MIGSATRPESVTGLLTCTDGIFGTYNAASQTRPGAALPSIPTRRCWPNSAKRQATPYGRARLRERTKVEHALAHVGHWQGRRAGYRGTRKNLFDLRRVAVIHNLHVIARQPTGDYQLTA
jgi:hypothetical protein